MLKHIIVFLLGVLCILWYYYPITANIDLVVGIISSWGAVIWTSYTFFDNKKWKKEIEKIKFLNQKDLETFRLYVVKKHENILKIYEAIEQMIKHCGNFDPELQIPIDCLDFSENEFETWINNFELLNSGDREKIIDLWKKWRNSPDTNLANKRIQADLYKYMYNASYKTYLNDLTKMVNATVAVRLYIASEDFGTLEEFIKSVMIFFMTQSPVVREEAGFNREDWKRIESEFNNKIIPLLKDNLYQDD